MIVIARDKTNTYTEIVISKLHRGRKIYMMFIPLIAVLLLIAYIYFDLNFTKVQYIDIESDKLQGNDKFKILQISDFHDSKSRRIWDRILTSVKELEPDVIVLTGDIIDTYTRNLDNVNKFVEEILRTNPNVYFVSGNHEWRSGYNIRLTQGLKSRGVTILNNANRVIKINGTEINLCGIDDYYTGSYDMDSAFNKINRKNFTILLSHAPNIIFRYKDIPADLILSGHTHGGQIRLPFIGALAAPGQGLFPKYNKGLYKLDNGKLLYIDSGVGTSILPIRFCNRSQISLITIKNS